MGTQRIYVSGRVQQVGYRDYVVRTAKRLGVSGWVRNLRDGRVELFADAADEVLAELAEACRAGPSLARVDQVEAFAADGEHPAKGFTKRFTA